jgi:hypothetical protein
MTTYQSALKAFVTAPFRTHNAKGKDSKQVEHNPWLINTTNHAETVSIVDGDADGSQRQEARMQKRASSGLGKRRDQVLTPRVNSGPR